MTVGLKTLRRQLYIVASMHDGTLAVPERTLILGG